MEPKIGRKWLRCKEHRYWKIVENRRVSSGKTIQQQVLYLGEINDRQQASWQKTIELFEDGEPRPRQVALSPEDSPPVISDEEVVRIRLKDLRTAQAAAMGRMLVGLPSLQTARAGSLLGGERPRQSQRNPLGPDFAGPGLLPVDRTRQRMEGLHRHWFETPAMAYLLGEDRALAEIHKLYRCHDYILAHKEKLFQHLQRRWKNLFKASFDILLYDLTSTYFESDPTVCTSPFVAA